MQELQSGVVDLLIHTPNSSTDLGSNTDRYSTLTPVPFSVAHTCLLHLLASVGLIGYNIVYCLEKRVFVVGGFSVFLSCMDVEKRMKEFSLGFETSGSG